MIPLHPFIPLHANYTAAVGFTMYKYIPLPYRVLYINSASFFWNGYLCLRFEDSETKVEIETNSIAKTTNDTMSMATTTAVERTRKAMDELYDAWKRDRH